MRLSLMHQMSLKIFDMEMIHSETSCVFVQMTYYNQIAM